MRPALTEEEITAFRASVCRAAEKLFARHGFEGVTMRQIAAEVGFSSTAAYRYFKNKDEILAAVRASAFNRFGEVIENATASSTDPRRSAREVGQAYLAFALANPDAYRMMFDIKQASVRHYPELAESLRRADRCMVGYVMVLVQKDVVSGDPRALGQMLWATAHGLVMLRLSGIIASNDELHRLHEQAMSALVRGMTPINRVTVRSDRRKSGLIETVAPKQKSKKHA